MSTRFASGKHAISECDRCGFRYPLRKLRSIVVKTRTVNLLVCPTCWEEDQPQLQLGMYTISDPQALRNPRGDNSYFQSGLDVLGNPSGGSRVIEWGWNPVGLHNPLQLTGLVDSLQGQGQIGTVTVQTNGV